MSCNICQILKGEIVPPGGIIFQNEHVMLSHFVNVNIPGYLLLSSVRHEPFHENLTDTEMESIGYFMKRACAAIKTIDGVERIYICSYCEETPHIHFHLFPRYHCMLSEAYPIYTHNKLDSPKLFNYFREKHQISPEVMAQDSKILMVVDRVRQMLIE